MNVCRYIWTIRYLKPVQILYQVKYRLFGYTTVESQRVYQHADRLGISIKALDEDNSYINRFKPDELLKNCIWLLNEMEMWHPGQWDFDDRTHLWNFNLHYFEYGIALAVSYEKTGNPSYYTKLVELYKDWHESCFGDMKSAAWHPYTISLRLKNLLIITDILDGKRKEWLGLVSDDIYEQFQYLMHNKEKNLYGNHYFENLITLYICCVFYKDNNSKKQIYKELTNQLKEQILQDGMHFERSFMYHNLILEDLLRLYKISHNSFRTDLKTKIQLMTNCVFSFESEYRLPAFNDEGSNVAKTRQQLINAANEVANIVPGYTPHLMYGGYFNITKDGYNAIIDAGSYGPDYMSGHSHCDMLSFELYYDGEPILVNAGTYQYQSQLRNYFRCTMAHNTLQINGVEQSEIWGEHRTGRRARLLRRKVANNGLIAIFKDYKGNKLKRRVLVDRGVLIKDTASDKFTSYWHIHPANKVKVVSNSKIEIFTPRERKFLLIAENGTFEDITRRNWFSEEFGKIKSLPSFAAKASVLRLSKV